VRHETRPHPGSDARGFGCLQERGPDAGSHADDSVRQPYGANATLPVHVKVDGGVEQPLMAMCEGKTCTIKLPLTNAKHELELAVEQQGRRSAPTQVSIDTSSLP
jgi:hypothetical protein